MSHPKRTRNAEIYDRTFVAGELSNSQATQEYRLSSSRIGAIITEEHRRRTGQASRSRLPARRPDYEAKAERDAEIYRRTVITRELIRQEAADAYSLCIDLLLASGAAK